VKARKPENVGSGPFLFCAVRDDDPRYVFDRSVSGDIELVNAGVAAAKQELRDLIGGKYLIHSSNSIREFFEQAVLLVGPRKLEELLRIQRWDGKVHPLEQDLAGADGWVDFSELLSVLNLSSNYLVLRNFECLPENFFAAENDIDILCDRLPRLAAAANATKRGKPHKLSAYSVKVSGRDVSLDARYIGDGYYDALWQSSMLARKARHRTFFVPRADDHFFSLLYHAKIQKREVKTEYIPQLEELAHRIGMQWVGTDHIADDEKAAYLLLGYLRANGFGYCEPADRSVVRNEAVLRHMLTSSHALRSSREARPARSMDRTMRGPFRAGLRSLKRWLGVT
jgi:hypothetical protein